MVTQRLSSFYKTINVTFVFAAIVIITSIALPLIFREEIISIGKTLLITYGQDRKHADCAAGLDLRNFRINVGF